MSARYPIIPLGGEIDLGSIRGRPGVLQMIPIPSLCVDGTYQRSISQGSVRNVRRICKEFDWSKFLPVIVVREGDTFNIVDGQHRTTAAMTLGITEVPCYVLDCSASDAAAAFAAINGHVTPVGPVDIWFAELAAGVSEAVDLNAVLQAADVVIVRKKDGFRVGETRSVNVLRRAHRFYGPSILSTVLQCIVQCGDGNPGMLVGSVINGVGMAIRTKPDLLSEPSALFDVFDGLDLSDMLTRAQIEFARTGNPTQFILTREINGRLANARRRVNAA